VAVKYRASDGADKGNASDTQQDVLEPYSAHGVTLALAAARTTQYHSTVMEVAPSRGATERGFHAERSWRRWKAATRVWLPHCQLQAYYDDWFHDHRVRERYGKRRLPAICLSGSNVTLTVGVTGGTQVAFSNITLVFGMPASGHFGSQAINGAVRRK
jgi:hypothetical protein